jgi:hypothetical protein
MWIRSQPGGRLQRKPDSSPSIQSPTVSTASSGGRRRRRQNLEIRTSNRISNHISPNRTPSSLSLTHVVSLGVGAETLEYLLERELISFELATSPDAQLIFLNLKHMRFTTGRNFVICRQPSGRSRSLSQRKSPSW